MRWLLLINDLVHLSAAHHTRHSSFDHVCCTHFQHQNSALDWNALSWVLRNIVFDLASKKDKPMRLSFTTFFDSQAFGNFSTSPWCSVLDDAKDRQMRHKSRLDISEWRENIKVFYANYANDDRQLELEPVWWWSETQKKQQTIIFPELFSSSR